ncbi:hypothetical protein SAMN06265337_3805 [Hymenobacter gelipurpurascens]|uniref:Uncharacterized protein n=1 Tax=Hymenobacter gelipurpurascens TaxID=89968 RepID=A0A212UGD2_9BACT|nr:hypothetical protein SAMN06265337_3805 [Hymenobacter gelipurpurascens]
MVADLLFSTTGSYSLPARLTGLQPILSYQHAIPDMFKKRAYHLPQPVLPDRATSVVKDSAPAQKCLWLGEFCIGDVECPSLYGNPEIRY